MVDTKLKIFAEWLTRVNFCAFTRMLIHNIRNRDFYKITQILVDAWKSGFGLFKKKKLYICSPTLPSLNKL